jgi:hypothetical protein
MQVASRFPAIEREILGGATIGAATTENRHQTGLLAVGPILLHFTHNKSKDSGMNIDPQATQIVGNIGLAAAAIYAARYLAKELKTTQNDLVTTLKDCIERNTIVMERVKDLMQKIKGPVLVVWFVILAGIACTCGCASVVLESPNGARITARVPAWPWQDSAQAVKRAGLAIHGTNTSLSLTGLVESELSNTNTLATIRGIAADAISAAGLVK